MFRSIVAFALPVILATAACSVQTEDARDEAAGDSEADVVARQKCSTTSYNAGLAHYKKAVAASKTHARDVCEATKLDVLAAAGDAVATCGAFNEVIRTSPYAAPIRTTLKGNLGLAALTGTLRPADRWAGLEASLAAGVTLFGPAPGVYGNMSKLTFSAQGKGTLERLNLDDQGNASWSSTPITWRVGAVRADGVELLFSGGGLPATPVLLKAAVMDAPYSKLPAFELRVGDERFDSLPSECEA